MKEYLDSLKKITLDPFNQPQLSDVLDHEKVKRTSTVTLIPNLS